MKPCFALLLLLASSLAVGAALAQVPQGAGPQSGKQSKCGSCQGTCNEELGRCDCPRGFSGDDCSQLTQDLPSLCRSFWFRAESNCTVEAPGVPCLNACNNRGQCAAGFCRCNRGFYGADCSLSLDSQGRPTLLAGLGYKTRARRPHVYVYELPPKYNAWYNLKAQDRPLTFMFQQRLLSSGARTGDGDSADYYLIPMNLRGPSDSVHLRKAIRYIRKTWPWWDKHHGARHIIIHVGDPGRADVLPPVRALTHNCTYLHHWGLYQDYAPSNWKAAHRPGQDIVVPIYLSPTGRRASVFKASPLHPLHPSRLAGASTSSTSRASPRIRNGADARGAAVVATVPLPSAIRGKGDSAFKGAPLGRAAQAEGVRGESAWRGEHASLPAAMSDAWRLSLETGGNAVPSSSAIQRGVKGVGEDIHIQRGVKGVGEGIHIQRGMKGVGEGAQPKVPGRPLISAVPLPAPKSGHLFAKSRDVAAISGRRGGSARSTKGESLQLEGTAGAGSDAAPLPAPRSGPQLLLAGHMLARSADMAAISGTRGSERSIKGEHDEHDEHHESIQSEGAAGAGSNALPRPPAPRSGPQLLFAGRICGGGEKPRTTGQWPNCPLRRNSGYSQGVRQLVHYHHWNRSGFSVSTSHPNYQEALTSARFCLAPTGGGHGHRQILVSFAGCIPLLIGDYVLQPFEPELNWTRFSVSLPQSEIPHIHTHLAAIDEQQYAQLQEALSCAAEHMAYSTFIGGFKQDTGRFDAFETTLEILRAKLDHPGVPPEELAAVDLQLAAFMQCKGPDTYTAQRIAPSMDADNPHASAVDPITHASSDPRPRLCSLSTFDDNSCGSCMRKHGGYVPGGAACCGASSLAQCPRAWP